MRLAGFLVPSLPKPPKNGATALCESVEETFWFWPLGMMRLYVSSRGFARFLETRNCAFQDWFACLNPKEVRFQKTSRTDEGTKSKTHPRLSFAGSARLLTRDFLVDEAVVAEPNLPVLAKLSSLVNMLLTGGSHKLVETLWSFRLMLTDWTLIMFGPVTMSWRVPRKVAKKVHNYCWFPLLL